MVKVRDGRAYMRPLVGEVRSIGSDIKILALNVVKKNEMSFNPWSVVDDLRSCLGAHNLSDLAVVRAQCQGGNDN